MPRKCMRPNVASSMRDARATNKQGRGGAHSLSLCGCRPGPQRSVCAQSRPRDGPGVPRPRGTRAGGRQSARQHCPAASR
eukprot:5630312-Prymnesium_polylepis.1